MLLRDSLMLLATFGVATSACLPRASAQTAAPPAAAQYVSDTGGQALDQIVEAALKRNGDLLSARQRIAEAQGLLTQSRLRVNPAIDASFASGRVLKSPGEREFGIGYSHAFELGGKRDRRIEVAGLGVELSTLEIANRERLLKADVKTRFAEALAAARNLTSAEQLYELNRQSYQIAQARNRQGEGTPLEEGLLRVEVNRIASDRFLFTNQIERAVLDLKTLAGFMPDESLKLAGALSTPKLGVLLDQAIARALVERPDLKAARMEESLTDAETRLAKSEAVPNVVASTRYSRVNSRFDQYGLSAPAGSPVPIRDTDNLLTGGISINLPLRNRNQGNIQAAVARHQNASLRRQYLERVIRQEVQAAIARYETATKALAVFDEGVLQQSRENVRILRAAYDLGEIRLMDVINEQRRLVDTQRAYTDLLREAFLAAVDLERATGAPIF
jgi:cobalt-zinc-cadmium efflux system outer membrane protein